MLGKILGTFKNAGPGDFAVAQPIVLKG